MRRSDQHHSTRILWLATLLVLLLTGCSSVPLWPSEEQATDTSASNTNPEVIVTQASVNRFLQTRRALSAVHKAQLSTLQQKMARGDQAGVSATLDVLLTSLDAEPQPASILLLAIGDGFQSIDEHREAEQYWVKAIEQNADNYFAHDRLGQYYRREGRFVLARKHYNRAISAWSGFANGYRNRGILFDLYMGDKAAALNDYIQYKQLLEEQGLSTKLVDRWIKEMQRAVQTES